VDISVKHLAADAQKYIDAARAGEEIIVTQDGVPVARLSGVRSADLLARLHRDGVLAPPAEERAVPRLPQAEAAKDALSSLLGRLRR